MGDTGRSLLINEVEVEVEDRDRGWTHFLAEFLTDETCMCCSMFSLEDFPLLRVTKLGPGDIPGNFWWACAARFSKS